jgi:hypothetical protein
MKITSLGEIVVACRLVACINWRFRLIMDGPPCILLFIGIEIEVWVLVYFPVLYDR